ncbi:MAG TPA: HepT-like ribonuclease domain-containing protein [Beijerinckiaceae bacterium]|jgi:uncharacterized protein with HEPN domain
MKQERERLTDIVAYARDGLGTIDGVSLTGFMNDRHRRLAARYCLLVIGEAAAKLTDATRAAIPGVPWNAIRGLRNRLAHTYDAIADEVVFETISRDLPELVTSITIYLDTTPEQP